MVRCIGSDETSLFSMICLEIDKKNSVTAPFGRTLTSCHVLSAPTQGATWPLKFQEPGQIDPFPMVPNG